MRIQSTTARIRRTSPTQWELRFCLVTDAGEVDGYWAIEPLARVDVDDGIAERVSLRNRGRLFGLGVSPARRPTRKRVSEAREGSGESTGGIKQLMQSGGGRRIAKAAVRDDHGTSGSPALARRASLKSQRHSRQSRSLHWQEVSVCWRSQLDRIQF